MRVVRVAMIEGQAVFDAEAPNETLAVLRGGGLVVYPTDTVYGIGADPRQEGAVRRLFAAKRRPEGMPISVAVASLEAARELAVVSPQAEAVCRPWLPGPVTLLFPPTANAPRMVVSSENTVAIRVPNHPVALFLAKQFGPITASSANIHELPPPVECTEAQEQLGDSVDLYVDAGPCPVGRESTVVDLTVHPPRVAREGAVSAERLGLAPRSR